jgi:hypothetical protein
MYHYPSVTYHEAHYVIPTKTLVKMYSQIQRFEMRRTLPTLRMNYQIHTLFAGKQSSKWEDFQEPYFNLFEPPRESTRIENAPYSEEFIRCFEHAYKQNLLSGQHLARLGLQALRDSGARI